MNPVARLLEIQELDLAADAARLRSVEFADRAAIPELDAALREIESRLATAREEQARLQREEEALGEEVSQIVRDLDAAELERYSGKRMDLEAARTHDAAQDELRDRKTRAEATELELLEALEAVESQSEAAGRDRLENRAEAERVTESIRQIEVEVEKELASLAERRAAIEPDLPPALLRAYQRVREQPRAHGRGAARLDKGRCTGCRIQLPSHENTKMLAEPEDAVIQCPQCRRILIR